MGNKPYKLIDPVHIVNYYAIYSTLKNDIIFTNRDFNKPIFCGGFVKKINQNVYNFKINELVGYISYEPDLYVNLSSNLIFKISNRDNLKLFASLPYAFFAMKIFRIINPKLGQVIIIIGLNFFSILLEKLIKLSGANVCIIKIEEDFNQINQNLEDCNIINDIQGALSKFKGIYLNTLVLISNLNKTIVKFLKNIIYRNLIQVNHISIYDKGFKDQNYIHGIKYPFSYIRWDFKENLKYYIYLVEKKIIKIDFIELLEIKINSLNELTNKIKELNENLLFLFTISLKS